MKESRKLKILFIMPLPLPFDDAVRWENLPEGGFRMNLHFVTPGLPNGPLAISAYIQKFFPETEIRIFDAGSYLLRLAGNVYEERLSYEKFVRDSLEFFTDFQPDIIGFSCMFNGTYAGLAAYSAAAAEKFPDAFITAGGHLAAAIPERILCGQTSIEAVNFGEGEIPFVKLCRAFHDGNVREYLEKSLSWYTAAKVQAGFRASHEFVENLDDIPRINPELLFYREDYNKPNDLIFRTAPFYGREIMLFPTRGCPNHCIFCASQNVHGHRVRHNSADRVKEDIIYFNEKYGITCFVFFDDSFLYNKKAAVEVLNFIGDHGFTAIVPTPAFFAIDDEVAAAFAHAGVKSVEVNIENGNQETLTNIVHKPSNLERAERTIKHLHAHGILAIGTAMIGFPGETVASMMKGLAKLKTMDLDVFVVWIVTPLPGSELWDICIKNGYSDGSLMSNFQDPAISTPDFSRELIQYLYHSYQKWLVFDNNRYFRAGKWKEAYEFFQNPLCRSSFMAEYYLAVCARKMGNEELFLKHRENYLRERKEETQGRPVYIKWADRELEKI